MMGQGLSDPQPVSQAAPFEDNNLSTFNAAGINSNNNNFRNLWNDRSFNQERGYDGLNENQMARHGEGGLTSTLMDQTTPP